MQENETNSVNSVHNNQVRVVLDAMGGDIGPVATVNGAVEYFRRFENNKSSKEVVVILVGKEEMINSELSKYNYDKSKIIVVDAQETISSSENPINAIRNKKNSSMVKALELVKNKEADAIISAGNTGALLAGATLIVGRIKGVERPALTTVLPTIKGHSILLDVGANSEVKPSHLVQFGQMASVYMEKVMSIDNPTVGLLNIGTEPEKGIKLYRDTYELLEKSNLNFAGNIEGRDISAGTTDVMLCDGFVGNILLKHTEGLGKNLFNMLKDSLMSSTLSKIGAVLSKNAFKELKKTMDYTEVGGAPFLGLKSLVVKAHGSSDGKAFASAINQCNIFSNENVINYLEREMGKPEES